MFFEFADSEVVRCSWADGRLQLRFSAAYLQENASAHAEVVWAPVLLTAELVEPWAVLEPEACIGRMRHGVVLHASERRLQLPVPGTLQGVVTMELEFAQGSVVRVRCQGLTLELLSATAVGAYQC